MDFLQKKIPTFQNSQLQKYNQEPQHQNFLGNCHSWAFQLRTVSLLQAGGNWTASHRDAQALCFGVPYKYVINIRI